MWPRKKSQKNVQQDESIPEGYKPPPPGYKYWSRTSASLPYYRKYLESEATVASAWLSRRRILWIAIVIFVVDLTVMFYGGYLSAWRLLIQVPGVFGAVIAVITAIIVIGIGYREIIPAGARRTISQNAALVSALLALAGVLITQGVNTQLSQQTRQNTELQDYLATVGELPSNPDSGAAAAVQAQTLTLLPNLNPEQKRTVIQFLYQANLINKDNPRIGLFFADLSSADLKGTDSHENRFVLDNSDLHGANLTQANLQFISLDGSNLRYIHLVDTDLRNATLRSADLSDAYFDNVTLSGADLSDAKLSNVDLDQAYLDDVELSSTDLRGANLQDTTGLTQKQIDEAIGDDATQLPNNLQRPSNWS
jgi:uncharacterized protein YjbI with pentapeptide repeats